MAGIVLARAVGHHGRLFGARLRAHLGRIALLIGPPSPEDEAILLGETGEAMLLGATDEAIIKGATAEAITDGAGREAMTNGGAKDGVLR